MGGQLRRYALRDGQWERIKDFLPGREGHVRVIAKRNPLFLEAVLHRYRAGIPWRDLPERFGDPITRTSGCLLPKVPSAWQNFLPDERVQPKILIRPMVFAKKNYVGFTRNTDKLMAERILSAALS